MTHPHVKSEFFPVLFVFYGMILGVLACLLITPIIKPTCEKTTMFLEGETIEACIYKTTFTIVRPQEKPCMIGETEQEKDGTWFLCTTAHTWSEMRKNANESSK